MEKATDPYTKQQFIKKRSNQVYANRENQVKHNNLKAKERRDSLADINKKLYSNLRILQARLGDNTSVIKTQEFLAGAGFNFGVITHVRNVDNINYYCIFNVGYRKITADKIELKSFNNEQ